MEYGNFMLKHVWMNYRSISIKAILKQQQKRGNVRGGNQINVTQWIKVRALRVTEPDSSSYTKSGKTPRLSKPDIFVDIS